jgi:hypothetical protein
MVAERKGPYLDLIELTRQLFPWRFAVYLRWKNAQREQLFLLEKLCGVGWGIGQFCSHRAAWDHIQSCTAPLGSRTKAH